MLILWAHLLLIPAYLLLGTLRHELAHTVSAWYSGWDITEFKCWPYHRTEGWRFGWVSWHSSIPATVEARCSFHRAPILAAIASYVVGEIGVELLPLSLDGLIIWLTATEVTALLDVGWLVVRKHLWSDGDLAEVEALHIPRQD